MSKLTTGFVKIGQSGPTIDGRTIKPEWLLQAAESYNSATYTALIWPDHMRFQNYGKVLELKAEEAGGVVSLYARIQPNASYVLGNQFGQRLFFSMEIEPNFAGTGKAYLVGLGITDTPASLGTDELKFSQRKQSAESVFLSNVECAFPSDDDDREPTWFTRFRKMFTTTPEEDPMDKAQFEELSGKVDALGSAVDEIKGSLAAFSAAESKPAAPEVPAAPETPPAKPESDSDKFATLTEAVAKLGQQVGDMAKRFEAAKPGTPVPPSTAPADDQAPIY